MRKWIRPRALAAGGAVIVLALGVTACGSGDDGDAGATAAGGTTVAGVDLAPVATGTDAEGRAFLEQDGDRLTGWIVVWGLEPGSAHASHLHANPEGETPASCADTPTDRHAVDFAPIVADAQGVAYADVDILVGEPVIRDGVYWMVHEGDGMGHDHSHMGGSNPGLLCGDVRPAGGEG